MFKLVFLKCTTLNIMQPVMIGLYHVYTQPLQLVSTTLFPFFFIIFQFYDVRTEYHQATFSSIPVLTKNKVIQETSFSVSLCNSKEHHIKQLVWPIVFNRGKYAVYRSTGFFVTYRTPLNADLYFVHVGLSVTYFNF